LVTTRFWWTTTIHGTTVELSAFLDLSHRGLIAISKEEAMSQDEHRVDPESEPGGYGTPTPEQEMPGQGDERETPERPAQGVPDVPAE
jgi:hypothetical protein